MGGVYVYGFRRGRRRDTPLRPVEEQWDILLPERHEGYVSWQEWLDVKEQLARNHSHRDGSISPPLASRHNSRKEYRSAIGKVGQFCTWFHTC